MLDYFFFNYDKSILQHIEEKIGRDSYLIAVYEDLKCSKQVWKSSRFNGFELFPSKVAAMESLAVSK